MTKNNLPNSSNKSKTQAIRQPFGEVSNFEQASLVLVEIAMESSHGSVENCKRCKMTNQAIINLTAFLNLDKLHHEENSL